MLEAFPVRAGQFPGTLPGEVANRFHSRDCDEVRRYVGRMFCDHTLDLVNPRSALDTRIAEVRCANVSLTEMAYGADVMIDAGQLEHFYLVQIPLTGRAGITLGGHHATCGPGMASVQHPLAPLQMYWSGDCRKMVVRYDRAGLERFAEAYLGHPLRSCLHFAPCLDTQTLTGAMLVDQVKAAIAMVRRCAEGGAGALPVLLEGHLENALMAALMFFQPHDLSEDMARAVPSNDPAPVRRVRDYLNAHAHEVIDMATLGAVAGVPVRTLHHQFRRALGISPMQMLREIRLERVRRELLQSTPVTNVTQIAMNWGFDHLGRFAAAYRERFGESPRQTLQRHRYTGVS